METCVKGAFRSSQPNLDQDAAFVVMRHPEHYITPNPNPNPNPNPIPNPNPNPNWRHLEHNITQGANLGLTQERVFTPVDHNPLKDPNSNANPNPNPNSNPNPNPSPNL